MLEAAAAGAQPKAPVGILEEAADLVAREPGTFGEQFEAAALEVAETAAAGAQPQRAVAGVGEQRQYVVDGKGRRGAGGEGGEADPVEAHEPLLGAQPQIAPIILDDGLDGILGETVLGGPCAVGVAFGGCGGIKRQGANRPGGDGEHHHETGHSESKTGGDGRHEPPVAPTLLGPPTRCRSRLTHAAPGRQPDSVRVLSIVILETAA